MAGTILVAETAVLVVIVVKKATISVVSTLDGHLIISAPAKARQATIFDSSRETSPLVLAGYSWSLLYRLALGNNVLAGLI